MRTLCAKFARDDSVGRLRPFQHGQASAVRIAVRADSRLRLVSKGDVIAPGRVVEHRVDSHRSIGVPGGVLSGTRGCFHTSTVNDTATSEKVTLSSTDANNSVTPA